MTAAPTGTLAAVVRLAGVRHVYAGAVALDDVTLAIPAGCLAGLIGPDGVGKSTLLALVAGARRLQAGRLLVLGGDMADTRHRNRVCPDIAYLPQGLGRNLYPDLSVSENIAYFARLFGLGRDEQAARVAELLKATGLSRFAGRTAGRLSGGMRQKLGLCCALIHDPDLLVLDEPTTGIDPLSRRQFWELIARIRARRPGMSVLVATATMEEAERFDWLVAMHDGRPIATGTPAALKRDAGAATLEDAFIALLPARPGTGDGAPPPARQPPGDEAPVVIEARGLSRHFGDFAAVERVSFAIRKAEIFGFVGSNGCGKTTTMKMLTGLLPPSAGEIRVFGQALDGGTSDIRRRVGYMSQSFSLYTELTVRQNLMLHARLFQLAAAESRARVTALIARFGLATHADKTAQALPLGIRQRLSLAVAIVHRPEILILDEPTSGVDPLARNDFWTLLAALARDDGITIFVSTHYMNEAERCDRVALMDSGRVLAIDTPARLAAATGAAGLEEAFIRHLEAAAGTPPPAPDDVPPPPRRVRRPARFSPRRLLASAIRETLELTRDRVRLGFAILGTTFLMLVFGFGISTDVNSLSFAVLDHDHSHESRAWLEELRGSAYFVEKPPLADEAALERRLSDGRIACAIEIPPGFGRDLLRGRPVTIAAWVDGARPFIAQTIRGYLEAMHALYLADPAVVTTARGPPATAARIEVRMKYNQNFNSVYAMVPGTISMELALFPAILMALAVVREKELGSIVNLYVTPLTRLEFLVGKQLPYIVVALVNFVLMVIMALTIFGVPLKGSLPTLAAAAVLYVAATTAYGMVVSTFARTQIAALFGTAILTVLPATMFAGMLVPVSSLGAVAQVMGRLFPMSYFLPVSLGAFTKGLGIADLWPDLVALAAFIPALTLLAIMLTRRQEP